MKNAFMRNILLIFLLSSVLFACSSSKIPTSDNIYGPTWELEYLSGPRIAFNALFKDRKPEIIFDKSEKRVQGTDGCNGYSATFTLKDNQISFGEPGPTTKMYCGEGDQFFLNTIKKINTYKIDSEGRLHLMLGDVTMMRFKKNR